MAIRTDSLQTCARLTAAFPAAGRPGAQDPFQTLRRGSGRCCGVMTLEHAMLCVKWKRNCSMPAQPTSGPTLLHPAALKAAAKSRGASSPPMKEQLHTHPVASMHALMCRRLVDDCSLFRPYSDNLGFD